MAELGQIYAELLNGTIEAVARSESRRLAAHVSTLRALNGQEPGAEELLALFEQGYFPDYFAGTELQINAQLTLTSSRERKASGGGGVGFGPVRIEASLSESFLQGSQTNLSVSCVLRRQSRSAGIEHALAALAPSAPRAGGREE